MPPKKNLRPITPSYSAPKMAAEPMKVAAPVAVQTENAIALGVMMICCTCLAVVFGASFMAAIVNLAGNMPPLPGNCQDTDISQNPFVSGTVLVKNANSRIYNYDDYCTSNGVQVDFCYGESRKCGLVQRFCNASGTVSRLTTGVAEFAKLCPNGCKNGACLGAQPACSNSDSLSTSTEDFNKQGITSGWNAASSYVVEADYCSDVNDWPNSSPSGPTGKYLVEFYCNKTDGDRVYQMYGGCENGCYRGACRKLPISKSLILTAPDGLGVNFNYYSDIGSSAFVYSQATTSVAANKTTAQANHLGLPATSQPNIDYPTLAINVKYGFESVMYSSASSSASTGTASLYGTAVNIQDYAAFKNSHNTDWNECIIYHNMPFMLSRSFVGDQASLKVGWLTSKYSGVNGSRSVDALRFVEIEHKVGNWDGTAINQELAEIMDLYMVGGMYPNILYGTNFNTSTACGINPYF